MIIILQKRQAHLIQPLNSIHVFFLFRFSFCITFCTLLLLYIQKHLLHHRNDWLTKIELCANKKPFWCGNVVKSFPLTKRNLIDWVMGSAITRNIFSKIWIIRFYFLRFMWHCVLWVLDVALFVTEVTILNSVCIRESSERN